MKNHEEICRAADILASATTDVEFARYMWGGPASEAATRVMFMLLTLGWVMDAEPHLFEGILSSIETQRIKYLEETLLCQKQPPSMPPSPPSSRHPRSN